MPRFASTKSNELCDRTIMQRSVHHPMFVDRTGSRCSRRATRSWCGANGLQVRSWEVRSIRRSVFSCLVALVCSTASGNELYQSAGEIQIGGEGGWDILTIDPTANRLFLAHATKVVVVDLGKNAV